ncbi:NAD(P)-dependent oxidoreductase [Amycolatopsis tolypomycina]|uniref:3-hydroxyisobutyrate dehydrogenase n=1 Tax=Amycolatopsis tolypomycina TaxID=208445 RepID=A0A1H5AEH1_9PSEU|nr:NAD(P)-binding domain-containing protein [Amycolatopsis tolypomycina]SED40298.1 3-hydroxyisobutyrate dehydrogenase [Amycolatopsis tolypomycina]
MKQPVTVLGLGSMGSALAGALLDHGHPVTVWNRTAEKAAPLTRRGARLAATPAEAIAASPLVVACVLDYRVLRAVVEPESLRGKDFVNLTSGSPEQAAEAAEWFGAGYLDGAIMTTPEGVGSAEVMVLYSGPRPVFDAHAPALAALGDPVYLGEDPGRASLYDAALLGLMWSAMAGWLHGTALVGAEKTTATEFTPVAIRWLGTVNRFLTRYAEQVDEGRYPGDDATVDVQIAAIGHLIHAAGARGVDNALPELLRGMMERASAAGHGADSFASLVEVFAGRVAAR